MITHPINVHIYTYTSLLTFITSLVLAIYVYRKNPKNLINRHYAFVNSLIGIWCSFSFLTNIAKTDISALIRARLVYISALYTGPSFYLFVTTFLGKSKSLLEKKGITILYIISTLFLPFSFSQYFIKGIIRQAPFCAPIPGPLYGLFTIFFIAICINAFYLLFSKYKQSMLAEKNQLKYLFVGFLVAFIAGLMHFSAAYFRKEPFSHDFLIISYLTIIAYAIVKHRLMDINIVIRKTLVYSTIIGLLFTISVTTLFTLAQIFGEFLPNKTFWLMFFTVSVLAFLFQPLYRWSTSVVDKLFFRGTLPQVAEELQRQEKLAALGVLASGLAHEIKNPLAPIKTYIQNLPDNLNNPHYIEKIAKTIPEEVDKITDIINQLRDFAQPPALSISKVNTHALIDKKINLLEQEFSSRNIMVEKQYSPTLPEINADPVQLERVFLNLFLNAIDAMQNGGRLTISTELNSNNSLLIKISDTGIGIDKENLPHIFDPFYSKGKHKGMGLGLAVAKRIIEEHGGIINVESNPPKSTIFYIYLPKGLNK